MVHSVHYCLGSILTTSPSSQQSVFNPLSVQTFEKPKSGKKKTTKVSHLEGASVNMITRGRDLLRSRRRKQGVHTPSFSSLGPDYSPGLGQVLVEQKGAFQGTHSRVAMPYNYGQPSFSEAMLPDSFRYQFQLFDDEEEANGYAFSATISSMQAGFVSANMAENNNDDLISVRVLTPRYRIRVGEIPSR